MKFRKKLIVIEAIRFDGGNESAVAKFMGCQYPYMVDGKIAIGTPEGVMLADVDDWIIKEPFPTKGRRFYPCKPDIFEMTYEKVE